MISDLLYFILIFIDFMNFSSVASRSFASSFSRIFYFHFAPSLAPHSNGSFVAGQAEAGSAARACLPLLGLQGEEGAPHRRRHGPQLCPHLHLQGEFSSFFFSFFQCFGSVTFWYRFGYADPYLRVTDGSGSRSCSFRQ